MKNKTLKIDILARVEGEGGLKLKISNGIVKDVQLKIYEPPRFFEAFLRGRDFREAPDITSRICGICPIAYQLGASHAMEEICGVKVEGQLKALRRLIYTGEWIESHVLHAFMLNAPDFFEAGSVIQLAQAYPEVVKNALRMKKAGNQIMIVLGGREIHPVNLRLGGFYKVPKKRDLSALLEEIKWSTQAAVDSLKFISKFEFPEFKQNYEFLALSDPDEYAILGGRLVSNCGINLPINEYDNCLVEEHVPHSTALHSHLKGAGTCLLGPLARYNLNFEQLTPLAREIAFEAGLGRHCYNPFKSILVRMVEVIYAFEEAERIIEAYEEPDSPAIEVNPRAGTGYGATEAPRGICYHRYTIDDNGIIQDSKIVAPTSVNQSRIEKDLWDLVQANVGMTDEKLKFFCERAIRNYDPCISCSTHFLTMDIERD
ncbi:Ni/Fe hydrogenase subunit alpha [Mucilaginibacter sp.]|uniref:Ni/Fe hydrogenase subunit alpha n=1 Tax=Mucilaginibacter sp. TaxID=1882438 RepID=UPI0028465785|nr:Ni/Fe hydrogenase subunit alpha [Mucilaginibacter sp.]MDR3695942.1 Ni/Fe hydrogenase subunit alpha [Mucilaginibacter sp.]